jgi:hypothetical protein
MNLCTKCLPQSEIDYKPIDDDRFEARIYASLFRVLERAPIEKRLQIFRLAVRFAAEQMAARRQQAIDDLWSIAENAGLIDLHGVPYVQDAFVIGFGGG